jgi:hypothetical protein
VCYLAFLPCLADDRHAGPNSNRRTACFSADAVQAAAADSGVGRIARAASLGGAVVAVRHGVAAVAGEILIFYGLASSAVEIISGG